MKRILSITFLLAICFGANSQDWESIKADSRYVWGEGWGKSLEEADLQALASLVSKITVSVTSDYRQVESQVHSPFADESSVLLSNTVLSYSSVTLTNTQRIVVKSGRRFQVGRWIRIDDLSVIFADRKARALEYERAAVLAEKDGRIDDALRYHYWAYTLIKSLQRPSEAKDVAGRILLNWIPEEMNSILGKIRVSCAGKTGDVIRLRFTWNGRLVQSLDFSYFDGAKWLRGLPVRNGDAQLQMARGALGEYIQLRIEYAYRGDARIDGELFEVMSLLESGRLKKSEIIFRR